MYLEWNKQIITNFSEENINSLYNAGWLFTRAGKGAMYQTRSVRVNLEKFEPSSENRRVLRKTENVKMETAPIPYPPYSWKVGRLGKDFYETKFGAGVFSANKIKELIADGAKSNFNKLLIYTNCHVERSETSRSFANAQNDSMVGYAICRVTNELLHYSYPFYQLTNQLPNLGISMMTRAIVWAKEQGKKYVYLGSAKDSAALYKFQFAGVEWWDGKNWQTDAEELKKIL